MKRVLKVKDLNLISRNLQLVKNLSQSQEQQLEIQRAARDPLYAQSNEFIQFLFQSLSEFSYENLGLDEYKLVKDYVFYCNIIDQKELSITIFGMKQGFKLALHDHIGITGIQLFLKGSAQINSFDFINQKTKRAKLTESKTVQTPCIQLIAPDYKNIHEIICLEDCFFMDIFVPNYTEENDINYFKVQNFDQSGNCILNEIPQPMFKCFSVAYLS